MNSAPEHDSDESNESQFPAESTLTYQQSVSDTDRRDRQLPATAGTRGIEWQLPLPAKIGRFTILRALGRGGFGYVYLAHDPKLDRPVALKVKRHGSSWNGQTSKTLLREAQLAAKVKHDRIVTIYDVGESAETGVFIAMEYVEGESLADRLRSGPLTPSEAVRIVVAIAEAIHFAHQRDLVHRDLKPANILLDQSDQVKVTDFGLALRLDDQLESKGEVSGTISYMSPEQFDGRSHHLDGRSDIWSLGIILYECLTGTTPFRAHRLEDFREELLNRPARPLRQVDDSIDPRLDDICRKCLARNPDDRYSTALDLRHDLLKTASPARPNRTRSAYILTGMAALGALTLAVRPLVVDSPAGAPSPAAPANPQPVPSRVTSSGDLLVAEPVPFLFDTADRFSSASYISDLKRFTVHTEGTSLFTMGDSPGGVVQIKLACTLKNNQGRAGVFWGLHEDLSAGPEATWRCLAALVSLDSVTRQARFYLQELTIEGSFPGKRRLPMTYTLMSPTWTMQSVEQSQSPGQLNSMVVTLEQGRPVSIDAFGHQCDLSEADGKVAWEDFATGSIGVITAHTDLVVSELVLNSGDSHP